MRERTVPIDVSGVRDRALLLVGFVGAFRRSELAAMQRAHVAPHPKGLVITIPRSKTDPYGEGQLVVMPYSSRPERCPVVSLRSWMDAAGIGTDIDDGDGPLDTRTFVFRPCRLALGPDGAEYSAHSLRAGFATYASQRGASDRAIAHQTRHRSLASLDQYIRLESAWTDNAATALDL